LQDSDKFRDGDVHTALSDFITADDIIMVSNSFPVRDLDLFGTPFIGQKEVYMNRGASGIDGITSTAIGLSLASNQSVLLITGDLAFLHDLNALLSFKLLNRRFTVVVINNNGGSIFRMLPAKHLDSYFTDYFETPQNINIHKICASFNVDSYRVSNKQQLKELLYSENLGQQCVIECVTDPDSSMQQRANIWSS
jgi:2-succinyl-5-enolpyruvyl-6-hydroxy-3-cyclohexene-1-carboxylate synthase